MEFQLPNLILHKGDAADFYESWPAPTCIISDGPYGVNGYSGDLSTSEGLAQWYEPHVSKWKHLPCTTLWFWNTEIGWARTHHILEKHGWIYRSCHVWDKGKQHVAGNANSKTLRKFPVTTEVCVQYVRDVRLDGLTIKDWVRREWKKTGLPMNQANVACGMKNAATRKYLTKDNKWYSPPGEQLVKMANYANKYATCFRIEGKIPSAAEWDALMAKFYCKVGVSNVWRESSREGRLLKGRKSIHSNQKPTSLIDLIVECSTDPGDVVWEPFGGLCSGLVSAFRLGRIGYSAEVDMQTYMHACERLNTLTVARQPKVE